jgi:hypothetical protein
MWRLNSGLLGTGFFDAETKRRKCPLKRAGDRGDRTLGNKWPEIPAETTYLVSCGNRGVCGDWVVVCAVSYEPVSAANSLLTGKLTGYFAISGFLEAVSFKKLVCRSGFSSNSLRILTGKDSRITGIEIELAGKNQSVW